MRNSLRVAGMTTALVSMAFSVAAAQAPGTSKGMPLDKWQRHLIEPELPHRSIYLQAADVDGDGKQDLVVGAWWYRNPGVIGETWSRHTIGEPLNNMAAVCDLDGDGDPDVLGTQGIGAKSNALFVWARNNGSGRFQILRNIPPAAGDFLQGIAVARFDESGPLQVALSWHAGDKGVQMFTVPEDPATSQWQWRKISEESLDEDLSVGDVDRDGDTDLLQGTSWLENPSSRSATWPAHVIGRVTIAGSQPDRNDLFDFNSDGQLDAVVGLEKGSDVLLFLAPGDPKKTWSRHTIGTDVGGGFSMDAADMDDDGDVDVLLGEHRGQDKNRVIIYENRDRAASWPVHVIDSGPTDQIDHHDGTVAVDIDGDGDRDVISIGWYNPKVWIFENRAID